MDDAWFARTQMGLSLGFHIVFAAVGVTMPLLVALAEARWLRRGDPVDLQLAQAWAKGTAVPFAVGAVSGTVPSFELGLPFPRFMEKAGAVIGPAFALEGAAFFVEAALALGAVLVLPSLLFLLRTSRRPPWTTRDEPRHLPLSGLQPDRGLLVPEAARTVRSK